MQHDEFIHRVQERAGLETHADAERLTKVVLGTLGERLYRTERDDLTAQLPKEMRNYLYAEQDRENTPLDTSRFSLEEFYNRVSARLDIGYPAATRQSKAVTAVLQEAVSRGEIDDALQTLSDEFGELFQESVYYYNASSGW